MIRRIILFILLLPLLSAGQNCKVPDKILADFRQDADEKPENVVWQCGDFVYDTTHYTYRALFTTKDEYGETLYDTNLGSNTFYSGSKAPVIASAVLARFNKAYPGAVSVQWYKGKEFEKGDSSYGEIQFPTGPTIYSVSFVQGINHRSITFDSLGNISYASNNRNLFFNIPEPIKNYAAQHFPGYQISSVTQDSNMYNDFADALLVDKTARNYAPTVYTFMLYQMINNCQSQYNVTMDSNFKVKSCLPQAATWLTNFDSLYPNATCVAQDIYDFYGKKTDYYAMLRFVFNGDTMVVATKNFLLVNTGKKLETSEIPIGIQQYIAKKYKHFRIRIVSKDISPNAKAVYNVAIIKKRKFYWLYFDANCKKLKKEKYTTLEPTLYETGF